MNKLLLLLIVSLFSNPALALKSLTAPIAVNQSMGASFNTKGANVEAVELLSFQAVWTGGGSPVGTFILQVSNDDPAPSSTDPCGGVINWSTYSGSAVAINADGDLAINVANLGYKCARLSYTRTSGTGTLNANVNLKVE